MTHTEIEFASPRGRIVEAALALATEHPWREVSLRDIAARAGTSLVDLREHCATKADVLGLLVRLVDDAVLAAAPELVAGNPRRDALFEVVMARFDALQPYRPALRSMASDASFDPGLARTTLASAAWMLQAAGIDTGGLDGATRVAGLAAVYASAFRVWLDDDDPGLARTMAALDRRLRRGERALENLDEMGKTVRGVGDRIAAIFSRTASRAEPPEKAPAAANEPKSDETAHRA